MEELRYLVIITSFLVITFAFVLKHTIESYIQVSFHSIGSLGTPYYKRRYTFCLVFWLFLLSFLFLWIFVLLCMILNTSFSLVFCIQVSGISAVPFALFYAEIGGILGKAENFIETANLRHCFDDAKEFISSLVWTVDTALPDGAYTISAEYKGNKLRIPYVAYKMRSDTAFKTGDKVKCLYPDLELKSDFKTYEVLGVFIKKQDEIPEIKETDTLEVKNNKIFKR